MDFKSLWLQLDLFTKVVLICGIAVLLFLTAPYFGISRHVDSSPDTPSHRIPLADKASHVSGVEARTTEAPIQKKFEPQQKVQSPTQQDPGLKESRGLAELEELLK
ncbi:MAG: hypothetical protein GX589_02570 [Deltaproteobacteria bacterium]|nr:hypothetical protein [Deltaproteobacteria bacterium]